MPRPALPRNLLDLARAAYFEGLYRGRSVLVVGVGDGAALEVLLARGASRVVAVDPDAAVVEAAKRRLGSRAELRIGGPQAAAGARFDLVLIGAGETLLAERDPLPAIRERLVPGGFLV